MSEKEATGVQKELEWLLGCFVDRLKHPDLLRDGVEAILTMDKYHLAYALCSRQYAGSEQDAKILHWLVAAPLGEGYPLLEEDDQTVEDFLRQAHTTAVTLLAPSEVEQFAIDVCDLLVKRGQYLWAREWRTICALPEPTDAELVSWAGHLVQFGDERAMKVFSGRLGQSDVAVQGRFRNALIQVITELSR